MLQKISKRKHGLTALVSALLCGIIVFLTLYVPEPIGLANNGDYPRIMYPNRIIFLEKIDYNYDSYVPEFEMVIGEGRQLTKLAGLIESDYSQFDYYSSQSVLIKISKVLNYFANGITGQSAGHYDLFWLCLIYIGLYVIAIYLILKFVYKRFGLLMFSLALFTVLFIFCDSGYTLYFNSFYGEAMQYVFTFLVIGLFLRLLDKHNAEKHSILSYVIYYAAVLFMAASKNAYVPVGILFALLPLIFIKDKLFSNKQIAYLALGTVVTFAGLIYILTLTPEWIDKDTTFNAVFSGILKFSDTPEEDLEELGLDPSLAVLKGYQTYLDDYPIDIKSEEFQKNFFDKISKTDILIFYLKNPARLLAALKYSADWAAYIRPKYLGNYINPSVPQEQAYRFSLWETFRELTCVNALWFIFLVFLLTFALCIYLLIKRKIEYALLLAVLLVSSGFNFVIPYISNGTCDIAKHMFGFINCYDILLFILFGYLVWRIRNYYYKRAICG